MMKSMTKPRIAFLGLGIMGSGMARRLLDADFPLTVYNRNPERSEAVSARGPRWRTRRAMPPPELT